MNKEFRFWWKVEIELVQSMLSNEFKEPPVNFRGISEKIIYELFENDAVPPTGRNEK